MSSSLARKRMGIAAVLSAMALVVLDAGTVNVALPSIASALEETPARSLLVTGVYQLALLIALLPCAQIADRIGYRRLFVGGVTVFGCAAVLSALAPTLPLLVSARGLQGLGGAAILSVGIALLRHALGADRLAAAIGWNALVVAICSALAPALGALLLSSADWRWLFVVALPLAGVALVCARALPAVPATRRSLDMPAIGLYTVALGSLFIALLLARSAPGAAGGASVIGAAAAWRLFRRERSSKAPLVPADLLARAPFRRSVVASLFLFAAQSAGLLALPFHLQLSLGRSIATSGFLIALWPLAVAGTSRLANRLADRFSCQAICAGGAMVLAAGSTAMAMLPTGQSLASLAACTLVCGIGFGLFQVPNNRNMFLSAPASRSAAAGGLQGTARLAGQTAGALLVMSVLSAAPTALAPRLAFGLAAAAAMAAALVSGSRKAEKADDRLSMPLDTGPIAASAAVDR